MGAEAQVWDRRVYAVFCCGCPTIMAVIKVELSRADEDILRRAIEAGGFQGPQGALHQALNLLHQNIARSVLVQRELQEKLVEGTRSGDPIPVDDNYWSSLRVELEARRDSSR